MNHRIRCTTLVTLVALAGTLQAQDKPERSAAIAAKEFRHADMTIAAQLQTVRELPEAAAAPVRESLARLGTAEGVAVVDARSGRFVTLSPSTPLVPGTGVGNSLRWADLKAAVPQGDLAREQAARDAFLSYLGENADDLQIDLGELATPRVTSYDGGELYHINAQRQLDGIPVRGSYVSATLSQGNLVLLGAHSWGDRGANANRKTLSSAQAVFAAEGHLLGSQITGSWGETELLYIPMAVGQRELTFGQGYRYQLAWSVKVNFAGDGGNWEALIDAYNGDLLANEDQNHYADAKGGVYPVTNDGIVPDGAEQAAWPMPYLTVGSQTTDTGGNLATGGSLSASLTGTYVRMVDNCGSISLTQTDNLDFGTSGGTDCTTPGIGGSGNTHASRSGFYELNKIKEMARGQLPSNNWLQGQLRSNMNINNTCNAYWSSGTVNFYRSGGGCYNTGEIAAVFDHEWGHGMDANDATSGIASPSGEGIADVYTALRLNTSCIGRHFRDSVCSGNGDACLTCTGVRDIDYAKRQSGNPHDFSWSNSNCGSSVHCKGGVYSEAVWSLWKRLLQAAPYNYDNNTAHEVVTRLTFQGAGGVGTWFSGSPPWGGCGSSSGYMEFLAADDDNGNLNDGTPHMTAIYNAFNDQEIACDTLTVQDSGCANNPAVAPSVTATPGNQSVALSWGSVATSYSVFRTEGVFACDFGKVKLGETTGTTWNDSGLQNGREYSYIVIPMGAANSCFGPSSSCTAATPAAAPQCAVDADCDDAIACTADSCNAGACVNAPNDGLCDNGAYCDGAEVCNTSLGCQAGSDPCPGFSCDEAGDFCIECSVDGDCDDGLFCNGAETCSASTCQSGSDPCTGLNCDEASDVCFSCASSGASCAANGDCCSNNCKGKPGSKTCK